MDNQLTHDEFLDVSRIIYECAYTAFNESRLEMRRGIKNAVGISDSEIDKYMEAYVNSRYASNETEKYHKYIRNELKEFIQEGIGQLFQSKKRAEIMAPVAAYSLIIHNEGTPSTVQTRAAKVNAASSEDPYNGHWKTQNPYRPILDKYRYAASADSSAKQIRALTKAAKKSSFFNSAYINQSTVEIIQQVHQLEGNLHLLEAINGMSRAGRFLNDILKKFHSDDCQLDTILRLYCVTMIHDVIQASRLLVDDNPTIIVNGEIRFKDYRSMDVVNEYAYDKVGYDLAYDFSLFDDRRAFPISLKPGIDSSIIGKFKNTSVKKENKFEAYYSFLRDNFDFAFPNIIDFYLDQDKLAPYINCVDQVTKYVEQQKKLVDNLPATKNEEPNLNVVLSTIHFIKNRKEVLEKQRYISKYATEEEEKAATLKQLEERDQNTIAVHPRLYETFEWQVFSYDTYYDEEFDISAKDNTSEGDEEDDGDCWKILENELLDMFYELSYQRRDYAYDLKQREYLRKCIQEKITMARNIKTDIAEQM